MIRPRENGENVRYFEHDDYECHIAIFDGWQESGYKYTGCIHTNYEPFKVLFDKSSNNFGELYQAMHKKLFELLVPIKLVRKPYAPKSLRKTVYIKLMGDLDGVGTTVWTSVNQTYKTGGVIRTKTLREYYTQVKP